MRVRTKRIYEKPAKADGRRVLIDRLWPRGLSKKAAAVDYNSVYSAARRGDIPTIVIGRRILVPVVALERMLSQADWHG